MYVESCAGILGHARLGSLAYSKRYPDHLTHLHEEAIRLDGMRHLVADIDVALLAHP